MTGNFKSIYTRRPSGFTLLETITVIAIFALTVTAVLNIYIIFFKNESQVERQTTVTADARFVMQAVQQALDTASVDYDYYGGAVPLNPPILHLITPQDETLAFRYNSTDRVVEMCSLRPANSPCNDLDPSMWTPLNDEVNSPIDSYQVWVTPADNPFERSAAGAALSNEQPRVTVVLHAVDRLGENALTLQTTLTSRAYAR
jgi:prepilin-type N-terminal cleavage/methylation domain-containing protein